jgi:hypothetical protein
MRRPRIAVSAAALVVAALGSGAADAAAPHGAGDDVARLCTAAETHSTVSRFVAAWNDGRLAALDGLVAPEPMFKWFSSGAPGNRGAAAFDRSSLRRYFARRHARRDHIQIRFFRFNGSDAREDGSYGHFEFTLERSAADYRRGEQFHVVGKGAVNCSLARTAIAVWSMSGAGNG